MGEKNEVRQRTGTASATESPEKSITEPELFSRIHGLDGEESLQRAEHDLNATEDDLLEAKELAATYSLDDVRAMMKQVYKIHKRDPNFPIAIINKIEEFLENEDVFQNPDKHKDLIAEMKIEAALITNNSPYAEVRAVVDNHDDPTLPVSTFRAWVIGIVLSVATSFVNVFFDIRFPNITISANVPQLLAYPLGKLFDHILPDWGFTLFGIRHSLNPGPFNQKEHMLITIMASVSNTASYASYLFWIQSQPQWFDQPWSKNVGYQLLIALSNNFIGYSLAGLTRRFLVYPSYCVWPQSLVTIALNSSFHNLLNPLVSGPFKSLWKMTRLRFFAYAFIAMWLYYWLPNTLFLGLSFFAWMVWISPNNRTLAEVTGSQGLGINPIFTFDWNIVCAINDPLVVPFFSTFSVFLGSLIGLPIIAAIFYTNSFYTAYLPMLSAAPWDRYAMPYNVSLILNENGIVDKAKYAEYSPPYLGAGAIMLYMMTFGTYSAVVAYALLYHYQEIKLGLIELWRSIFGKKEETEKNRVMDVHNRLMSRYKEVPEWWFMIILVISAAFGCAGAAAYPTHASPGTIFFGLLLAIVFLVPMGIIYAMTGLQLGLNVLAEFIGGAWVEGNAIGMYYFKTFGYFTTLQAQNFAKDMKLAHYVKIPPRITFCAQMVPTLVVSFVSVGILQYQMGIDQVCTPNAPYRFFCISQKLAFTSAVLWGTAGPRRLFGTGGQYTITLIGFPIGVVVVLAFWALNKKFPKNKAIRSIHPCLLLYGSGMWTPYNIGYYWPGVPVAAWSWLFMRKRFLGWWSKYNYVLSAAFSCGLAISALVQFFALAYNDKAISWWGNNVLNSGCDAAGACPHKVLAEGEAFGPAPGTWPV